MRELASFCLLLGWGLPRGGAYQGDVGALRAWQRAVRARELAEADALSLTSYPMLDLPPAAAGAGAPAAAPLLEAASPGRGLNSSTSRAPPAKAGKLPFYLGVGSSAYQSEGAVFEDGRGPSIWDTFLRRPGVSPKGETGDVADDFYHRFPEDIQIMQSLGIKHFRFSVAWPRIFPNGTGVVNQRGMAFYSRLVDALLAAGITPSVTVYHWDLPQALQDRYSGWEGGAIVQDFADYAEAVFRALKGRVTLWTTLNEPWTFCFVGLYLGKHAPGKKDEAAAWRCVHNVLLAHAAAVQRFRAIFPPGGPEKVSLTISSDWFVPRSFEARDVAAAQRQMEIQAGVFGDPLHFGDYPAVVRQRVPALPAFTPEQAAALRGSSDYFALNHYTSQWAWDVVGGQALAGTMGVATSPYNASGAPMGPRAESDWLFRVPWGFREILRWVNNRYHPVEVQVTENGCDVPGEEGLPLPQALNDTYRCEWFRQYVQQAALAATVDKVPITAYYAWSLLDGLEWAEGYASRFGIVHIDFRDGLGRRAKQSAYVLQELFGL